VSEELKLFSLEGFITQASISTLISSKAIDFSFKAFNLMFSVS